MSFNPFIIAASASTTLGDVKKAHHKPAIYNHPNKSPKALYKAHEEVVEVNATSERLTQLLLSRGSLGTGSGVTEAYVNRIPGRPGGGRLRKHWPALRPRLRPQTPNDLEQDIADARTE